MTLFPWILTLTILVTALLIEWFRTTHHSPSGGSAPVEMALLQSLFRLSSSQGGFVPPIVLSSSSSSSLGGFPNCPVPDIPPDMVPMAPSEFTTYLTLPGTGDQLPQVGIGMCCRATAQDPESVRRTILWYLLLGGRHVDTAHVYGNQKIIGQALQEAEEVYGIPRSLIFVTSKVWRRDFGYFNTYKSIPRILEELGLEYLDLLLLHAPTTTDNAMSSLLHISTECSDNGQNAFQCRAATWKAMALAKRKGLVRNIGVSDFNIPQLQELQSVDRAPIAIHQLPYHPWIPDHVQEIHDYCHSHGIPIMATSPLAGSALQSATTLLLSSSSSQPSPLSQIAESYNRTTAQLLLRWSLQQGNAVIPGTGNPHHMVENLEVHDFSLKDHDMDRITALRYEESATQFFLSTNDFS